MLGSLTTIPADGGAPRQPAAQEMPGAMGVMQFFEHSPLAMWVFDVDTLQFLTANSAATRQYGWGREELLEMTAERVRPVHTAAAFRRYVSELRVSNSGVRTIPDFPVLTKDGYTRRAEAVWQLAEMDGRRVVHATMIDRTAQYEAQEHNEELAEVLNLASDAIVICDLEREIVFWNQGAARIYGWSAEEAVGKKVHVLLGVPENAISACMTDLMDKGEWRAEIPNVRKDGGQVIVNSRWTLARNEETQIPKCVLLINSDITERKLLEAQFLRAQRLESIGTLASGIAHDLNNILSPILMATGILRQATLDEGDVKMLEIIEASAERGASIVKQVLTFARGSDGERAPMHPKHVVTEMTKVMAQTFPRNIHVTTAIPEKLWLVIGDATQLHQILLNLCVNARDAIGDRGGNIRIACENVEVDAQIASMNPGAKLGPHVCLSVTDTGSGMTPEQMEKIFDPFYTTKDTGKGTGLGLATVLGIVKGHRGFITFQSQWRIGTTFRVFLPASVEANEQDRREPEIETLRGNGETVLVVDDESTIREAIVTTLNANGYHCYTAEDGKDALALFFERRDNISVVITDLHMAEMDGVDLTRSLRRLAPEKKVIISSGHISADKRAILEALNVVGILEKPYTMERLLRSVKGALVAGNAALRRF